MEDKSETGFSRKNIGLGVILLLCVYQVFTYNLGSKFVYMDDGVFEVRNGTTWRNVSSPAINNQVDSLRKPASLPATQPVEDVQQPNVSHTVIEPTIANSSAPAANETLTPPQLPQVNLSINETDTPLTSNVSVLLFENETLATINPRTPQLFKLPGAKPSVVLYKACCGLGHRLCRMAAAHYVAKVRFNYGLTANWGYCDKTEVFSYLFEPEDLSNVIHDNKRKSIRSYNLWSNSSAHVYDSLQHFLLAFSRHHRK